MDKGWSWVQKKEGRGGQGQHRVLYGLQSLMGLAIADWVTYDKLLNFSVP